MNSEPFLEWPELLEELQALEQAIDEMDSDEIQAVLERTVEGYASARQALELETGKAGEWPQGSRLVH